MLLFTPIQISLKDIFIGENGWGFLPEVILRSAVMYFVLFISLKATGKRGVKQLSVFELIIILGLGSAAGDPMFYKEVGIIPVMLVFLIIVVLYRLTTLALSLSPKLESLLEGDPTYIIEDGLFCVDNINKKQLGEDEFLAELRVEKISHLGQVRIAILETDGNLSVFYNEDDKVGYGLPTLPKQLAKSLTEITKPGHYSCKFCGFTKLVEQVGKINCTRCVHNEWVVSSNEKRIT
jgi:uncharacterized membrane protein YcaP (DUF421 family)